MRHGRVWLALSALALAGSLLPTRAPTAPPRPPAGERAGDDEPSPEERRERLVVERFLKVLEKNPRRGTALDRVYGYHVERGSLDRFVRGLRARVRKDPRDGTAWMVLGLVESQRGRDGDAVAAFREAERHRPDDPTPAYYLGQS